MSDATVKGQLIIGIKRFLKEKHGDAGYEQFLQAQTPEDQDFWENKPLVPISRVPAKYFVQVYETMEKLWGRESFLVGAATVAFYDLNSIMKIFMKIGTPSFIAKRMPSVWRQYFSAGQMKIVQLEEKSAQLELLEANVYQKAGCEGAEAWTAKALEYSGAENLIVKQTQCCFSGSDKCVITYSWD